MLDPTLFRYVMKLQTPSSCLPRPEVKVKVRLNHNGLNSRKPKCPAKACQRESRWTALGIRNTSLNNVG